MNTNAQQSARNSLIGVMYFMILSFFLGKKVFREVT